MGKPDAPDAKIKFLAAEALRGVGGLVFDANGKRFANELGRRDYVTGEMWKDMGVPLKTLVDEHQQHYEASQKAAKDPEGGSWPAYPSGKSWDAASGPTG